MKKLEKENVRLILCKILDDVKMYVPDSNEAVKQLAYIAGLRDMANAVIKAIDETISREEL